MMISFLYKLLNFCYIYKLRLRDNVKSGRFTLSQCSYLTTSGL